jgi:SRSO17 transposase
VSSVLVAAGLAWPVTFEMYLPPEWLTDEARERAGIPATVRFRDKWRVAFAHVREIRKTGVAIEAVVADAEYGRVAAFRRALERLGLRYGLAIPWFLAMWPAGAVRSQIAGEIAARLPASVWHRVCWG